MSDNYRNIGKLVAVFGLQGELVLQHRLGKKTGLKGLKALFIEEKKGEMLPWFIQGVRPKGAEDLYVKLEGIDTKECCASPGAERSMAPRDGSRAVRRQQRPHLTGGLSSLAGRRRPGRDPGSHRAAAPGPLQDRPGR